MNWKQLLSPQPVHSGYKRARRAKAAIMRPWRTGLLYFGWPRPIARYLGDRRFESRVVSYKQGVRCVVAGDRFFRFALSDRSAGKLLREQAMWKLLREQNLETIVQRSMNLVDFGDGKVLESEVLHAIKKEEQVAVTLPIIRKLVGAARPAAHRDLPATIDAGLKLALLASEGVLPNSFASEAEIREILTKELMTGISHLDLHYRNVMRDVDGRPVLIDLKSCDNGRILSTDLIAFACKYTQVRTLQNLVEAAFSMQQERWRVAELEPVLALVDLPRSIWAQIFVLDFVGSHALKRERLDQVNPLFQKLFFRVLSKNWRTY